MVVFIFRPPRQQGALRGALFCLFPPAGAGCEGGHLEDVLQVHVVLDPALLPGLGGQVGEPDHGNPVLQVGRTNLLELLPLLGCHEPCRDILTCAWAGLARLIRPHLPRCSNWPRRIWSPEVSRFLTGLHQVLHGGEALADGRADGAEDEQRGQVDVADQGPAQQAPVLVRPLDTAESAERPDHGGPGAKVKVPEGSKAHLEMRNMRRSGQGRLTNWFHHRFTTRVT